MLNFLKMLLTPEFFFSIIRISAPILFATLAAIVVEKAGFCNIGLEGLMMFSALTGSLVSYYAHSWVWGLLAALAIGVLSSILPAREPAISREALWKQIPSYSEAVKKICAQCGALYADNTQLSEDHADLWQPDGVHLLPEFYPYWAANLIIASWGEIADA